VNPPAIRIFSKPETDKTNQSLKNFCLNLLLKNLRRPHAWL